MAPIIPIGALLGKADAVYKMVGGSSVVFNLIRAPIFGKSLRAVEYPSGVLRSIKIRRMNRQVLQSHIADVQPPPFPTAYLNPQDIRQIAVFTSPHFTEPVLTDSDVSAIPDNAWLLWSKDSYEEAPIPLVGVKLDGSHVKKKSDPKPRATVSELVLQDRAISIATRILAESRSAASKLSSRSPSSEPKAKLSQWQHDRMIDLAVDRDAGLLTLARNYGDDDEDFVYHALRLLRRRGFQSTVIADGGSEEADDDSEGSDESASKKPAEPQVELATRED